MAGSPIGDLLSGMAGRPVDRPGLQSFVANSQAINGLRSAQTEEAMFNAQKLVEQQRASSGLESALVQGGHDPSEAHMMATVMQSALGDSFEHVVKGLGEQQQQGFRGTLGDPTQLGSVAQTAAQQGVQGRVAGPVAVPSTYTTLPGAYQPQVQQTPQGAATTAEQLALAKMHNTTAGAGAPPSQLDIDTMADRYNITGQLPPLGMGASALRRDILVSAAAAARGERPQVGATGAAPGGPSAAGGTAANAASFSSGKVAMSALQKQSSLIDAYEQTAGQNLDLANSYVNGAGKTLDETGSPLINRALLHFRQGITGDPATQQFVLALTTARDEYARVISAATGATGITDAGRAEALTLFPNSITPQQLGPAIITAKAEMENRANGLHTQIDMTKNHIANIGGQGVASGGGPGGSVASGATPVTPVAPNAAPGAVPPSTPASYTSEAEALAAGHKVGDRVTIGGVSGTLQ